MKLCKPPNFSITSTPGFIESTNALLIMHSVPAFSTSSLDKSFTEPFVAHGMKKGVSTAPCSDLKTPARAAPLECATLKPEAIKGFECETVKKQSAANALPQA